jgi:hypothetical protein
MATHINITTEQIQPAVLTRLASYVQRTGKTVNEVLQQMLEERETSPLPAETPSAVGTVTSEEWSHELHAWVASHPVTHVTADNGRESIDEGRGE